MDMQELSQLIRTRRSIRKWEDRPVPEELILQGLELATWAPNGGNYQGWAFVVVTRKSLVVEIADRVQEAMDKVCAWPEADQWREEADRYRTFASFFRNAPALIAIFSEEYQSAADKILAVRETRDPEAAEMRAFRKSAPTGIQSGAAAITTMLLAFHAMGLGSVWLAAPLLAKKDIERLLDAPEGASLTACVALGYPDERPERDRKPVDSVVRFIKD
jgi:nitroreductase